MDWDHVRSFLAVARKGQFLGGARLLRINQATVARRVSALEATLGTTLFERSTSGVILTDAGKRLLAHAERMESEMLQAEADVRGQDVQLSGQVRIGAPDGFATFFLMRALAGFLQRHPGIDIQIVPMPLPASLARREVDIAITLENPVAGRVVTRKLTDYSLGIFGARGYLKRHPKPAGVADLSGHRLIGYAESYAVSPALGYIADLFGGHRTAFECASAVGQVEAVRSGLGLGVLHHFISSGMSEVVAVLPERRAIRSYWLSLHEDVRAVARIRATVDHIATAVENNRARFLP